MKKISLLILVAFLAASTNLFCQNVDDKEVKIKISEYKKDPKGPYQQIMWFCPDGSKVPPKQRCPEKGGVQRATYKAWVDSLASKRHIFLGQILAATKYENFLDENNNYSRLKQYQLEKYLEDIDNGWILRRAKYYRGAFQDEDENEWGAKFLSWSLTNNNLDVNRFFLLKQTFRYVPHKAENSNIQKVRAISMTISDTVPEFMDLRIKIHGKPDASDLKQVKDFKNKNGSKYSPAVNASLDELIAELEILYKPVDWQSLNSFLKPLGETSEYAKMLQTSLDQIAKANTVSQKISIASSLLLSVRKAIPGAPVKTKISLLDLSNRIEDLIFIDLPNWQTTTLAGVLEKNYSLSMAAAGAGYIELWEWNKISHELRPPAATDISVEQLNNYMISGRKVVEWSAAMIRANYGEEIKIFEGFEPMTTGFTDNMIRSSILLQLGQSVSNLGNFINTKLALSNKVFSIPGQSNIRGINPGFAKGELVVADSPDGIHVSSDKIYIFQQPPADLKPVAGIATVSEGNLVSHVQLLARNLGIPNSVVSPENFEALKAYSGNQVFYAVSNKGTVVMKLADNMTAEEKALFAVKNRSEEKIRVPVDKIDLKQLKVLNLRQVNASSSGKLCGPKAANLGQLKLMFPENVVEGLVIPFGIFRQHMDQKMPGSEMSYWGFLNAAFQEASQMESVGKSRDEIDKFLLGKLETLRNAIKKMPLMPSFVSDFKSQFLTVFGKPMGSLPVFLRSDTNMEDLKDFTGAGLNLTIFNVVSEEKILQGIKDVWASPYSERSFQWRQKLLLNPESVYPSILVIPSVNVDYSGVLITKGVSMGTDSDLTVAFSRGAGGAVDGQAAETYILQANGKNILLAPSREPTYNTLPLTGGALKQQASFDKPILKTENLIEIKSFSKKLSQKMAETKSMQGPYDVELGFQNDKLWLFQVRPFVENKNAAGSLYLESITPKVDETKRIQLSEKL
ncbi:MAG TPA: PEP/pyruvate-binding domain-containing protein [Bacteroidales bacterium]